MPKFGKNLLTGSEDAEQTRKCHADTKANEISTKNNRAHSPWFGDLLVADTEGD